MTSDPPASSEREPLLAAHSLARGQAARTARSRRTARPARPARGRLGAVRQTRRARRPRDRLRARADRAAEVEPLEQRVDSTSRARARRRAPPVARRRPPAARRRAAAAPARRRSGSRSARTRPAPSSSGVSVTGGQRRCRGGPSAPARPRRRSVARSSPGRRADRPTSRPASAGRSHRTGRPSRSTHPGASSSRSAISGTNAGAIQRRHRRRCPVRRHAVELGRAAQDQPLPRPRHRDVEQPPLLAPPRRVSSLGPERLVVERRHRGRPVPRCASRSPSRPSRADPQQLGAGRVGRARGRRRTRSWNSSPLARWIVISRTASSASPSTGASLSRDSAPDPPRAVGDQSRESRAGRARRSPRTRARAASACARSPAGAGRPAARASRGRSRSRRAPASISSSIPPRATAARSAANQPANAPARSRSAAPAAVDAGPSGSRSTHHGSRPALARRGAQDHERVERDADQRRGEHRVQRLLVARVGERAQVGDHVDHLRVGPVAAARRSRRSGSRAPRARARRRAGRSSRGSARRLAGRARRPRSAPRTRPASARASASRHGAASPSSSQSAPLSAISSSTRGPGRGGSRAGRHQRPEAVAERARERRVERRQDLRPRAEVGLQRRARRRPRASRSPRRSNSSTSAWRNP